MPGPKIGATHYHAELGLPGKVCSIKGSSWLSEALSAGKILIASSSSSLTVLRIAKNQVFLQEKCNTYRKILKK